jgi:hypothetical protein
MTNATIQLDNSRTESEEMLDEVDINVKHAPSAPVVGSPILLEAETAVGDSSVEYEWEFSDGATATGQSASNIFENAGKQSVSLTITDSDGETETVCEMLTVYHDATVEICENDCEEKFVTVVLRGDSDFDPAHSVAVDSLRFGAPTALAMGSGASPVETDVHDGDLRIQFHSDPGLEDADSPGRIAGCTTDGVPLAGTADAI